MTSAAANRLLECKDTGSLKAFAVNFAAYVGEAKKATIEALYERLCLTLRKPSCSTRSATST